jgi:hypothetical protein
MLLCRSNLSISESVFQPHCEWSASKQPKEVNLAKGKAAMQR